MGTLAGPELRKARQEAHKAFDAIWIFGKVGRREAYAWLAEKMGIEIDDCHIGGFGLAQCAQVLTICEERKKCRKA